MVSWSDVKNKIKNTIITIEKDPLASALIKPLLGQIPFVGNILSDIYENAAGNLNDKSSDVLKLLNNLYNMTDNQLDIISNFMQATHDELVKNNQSLTQLITYSDDIKANQYKIITLGTETLQTLQKFEDKIVNEYRNTTNELRNTISAVKFNTTILPEKLRFYLKLQENLRMSKKIYLNQLVIRTQLEDSLNLRVPEQARRLITEGGDDFLYLAHPLMNDEERKLFDFIRRTTEDMNQFNSYTKSLLENNREFFTDMSALTVLYEHYCWWQAKYDVLKDDPNMCLIYVGPKQGKYFPYYVDDLIKTKIEQLRKETRLTPPAPVELPL
jgi:hypothetical protein